MMHEISIQSILYHGISHNSIVAPNYMANKWFECDMFAVSRNLYSTEYEIKTSIADYHNDFNKVSREVKKRESVKTPFRIPSDHWLTKHDILSGEPSDKYNPPNHFYFVLYGFTVDVPDYCGCIIIDPKRLSPIVVKKAPKIHKVKVDQDELVSLASSCGRRLILERSGKYIALNYG